MNRNKMMLILLLGLVVSLIVVSCKKEASLAPSTPPGGKDPRTYTWTVDTLQYPGSFQTAMMRIWGSSPTDVYVVGHNDVGSGKMYHYNGQRWQVVRITQAEGGPILRPDLTDINGSGAQDIFAVGVREYENPNPPPFALDSSLVIHYDGSRWSEIPTVGSFLNAIAVGRTGFAYAAGMGTIGFAIRGQSVLRDSVAIPLPDSATFQINTVAVGPNNEVYANGNYYLPDQPTLDFLFLKRGNDNRWTIIDSARLGFPLPEARWGDARLWYSPWGTLYSTGRGVFTWDEARWSRVYDASASLTGIDGNKPDNLFVVGYPGQILHFNGRDWYRFAQFSGTGLVMDDVIDFEDEVFAIGTDGGGNRTFVLHGK